MSSDEDTAPGMPSRWRPSDEIRSWKLDLDPVDPPTARDVADYWVMVYGTGSQKKSLHVPAPTSTRDEPVMRCGREIGDDARVVAKDLSVFPPGYDPDRICTDCCRQLALEIKRGDLHVE